MGRTDMWQTIHELAHSGITIFLTTQYLEEADRLADEIAILHGGRIVAEGSSDELKTMVPAGIVELEFGEEEQLVAAHRALDGQYDVSRVDTTLVVATTGSVAEMADMFIRLKDTGIEPARFTKQTTTLDDVFFKILGEERKDTHASSE
jgi:ABC-2 type transport system ATP-binding protein